MSDSRSSKIENIDIVDPIGEIRRRAKELWRAAGEPADRTWEDFFQAAEDDLLGGRSSGDVSPTNQVHHPEGVKGVHSDEIAAEVAPLVSQGDNLLLSVVASAAKSLLIEHDSICLARVLSSHLIQLRSGEIFEQLEDDLIAPILAELANEYNSEFLKKHGVSDGRTVNFQGRIAYWKERLQTLRRLDEPLSYADRNTVARLRVAIAAEPRVLEVTFRDL